MIVGIDLGTTNCACAVFRDGAVEMIPNSLGHVLTPSAVSIDDNGDVIVGLPARERKSTHASTTATAFKRLMGTRRSTKLGKLSFSPEELSALMLQSLKRDAEAYLGEPVSEAVITVPAYFNDKQRKATRHAGVLAGLKVERLINEPTAAALAYGIHQRDRQTKFLVFDLGGGTFDVSVLEIFEGVIEVRASAGDTRLGGEDFNDVLIGMAGRRFGEPIRTLSRSNDVLYQRCREAAERTRRALTGADSASFSFQWQDKPYAFDVDVQTFEQECVPLLARLRDPVLRSLRDSHIDIDALDEVLLVGGATRMPLVRKAATRMFGRFPSTAIDPDEAVARGAAIQAALKARDSALREVVLTDVCPYTLGVEAAEGTPGGPLVHGVFAPIIERNCTVPASREKTFYTIQDNQPRLKFSVYQGEARWVRDNILLGEIEVPVPPGWAGESFASCRFSYDINGLLEVDVHVPATNEHRQLVIVDKEGLSPEELEQRRAELAKLKIHPRDADINKATLSRAGRCYENTLGDTRAHIGHLIGQFERVLEGQDPRASDIARKDLERILDELEGQLQL
ncbi:Hsp70 family protein [Terricaulis sp.]|uniref:Hsp70 family protein n=1 Tax=Terricaulis sp. TaxID=2768686 RepID=UPI003783C8F7